MNHVVTALKKQFEERDSIGLTTSRELPSYNECDLRRIDRFGDVYLIAGRERTHTVFGPGIGSQGYGRNRRAAFPLPLPEFANKIIAV